LEDVEKKGWLQLAMQIRDQEILKDPEGIRAALWEMRSAVDAAIVAARTPPLVVPPEEKVAGYVSESWRTGV